MIVFELFIAGLLIFGLFGYLIGNLIIEMLEEDLNDKQKGE